MRTADPMLPAPAFYSTQVTPYFNRPDWLMSAVGDIVEIAHLAANWNSYGSPQLTPAAKGQAVELALKLSHLGLPEPLVAPVSGGGVQFVCSLGPRALELEVLPDGAIDYLRVYGDDTMKEGRINPALADHLREQVRWLVEHP
jgi:hypothetical protein